jgi:hypothetical protein
MGFLSNRPPGKDWRAYMRKNILVPLGSEDKDLRSVQHALALARRIPARVFILSFDPPEGEERRGIRGEDVLTDLIAAARQAGLDVSYHRSQGPFEQEVVDFILQEKVHIVVLGDPGGGGPNRLFLESRLEVVPQVILVRQKDDPPRGRGKRERSSSP